MNKKAMSFLNTLITDETPKVELDIIKYLKRLVNGDNSPTSTTWEGWTTCFETLWKFYPRKVGKAEAKKVFERKMRGLSEREVRHLSNEVWTLLRKNLAYWEDNETEMQYIPHFSTWLNREFENSTKR